MFNEKATAQFWDEHWDVADLKKYITNFKSDDIFIPQIQKYLTKGATILEGGCGRGQLVYALWKKDYKPIGIDFAKKTVEKINEILPELDVREGDVRHLDIDDNSMDGYISGGVIEHFWEGYDDIINEMYRIIKPGGYLFITFPSMSKLRKWKAKNKKYDIKDYNDDSILTNNFYQFVLDDQFVIRDLENIGFKLVKIKHIGGLKGLKDEVRKFKNLLQFIYDGKYLYPIHSFLNKLLAPFTNHMTLLILKK